MKVTASRNTEARSAADELSSVYEGDFIAVAVTCECRKVTHTALPEDHDGAVLFCDHCGQTIVLG